MLRINRPNRERRKYHRMTINAELTYRRSPGNSISRGFCKNLSHSGLLFVTEQALNCGDSLDIFMDTKSTNLEPLKVTARVVRVEFSDKTHSVACRIVEYQ